MPGDPALRSTRWCAENWHRGYWIARLNRAMTSRQDGPNRENEDVSCCPLRRLLRLQAEAFFDRVAHDEFLDLAGHRHRELVDELDVARDLVVGDLALAEAADLVASQSLPDLNANPPPQ